MMRRASLLVLAAGVALWGVAGCSDDDAVCGNGVVEGNEQCDLTELGGNTCADVVAGSEGTLLCTGECTFDTSGCGLCGDGVQQTGEDCDCGDDPNNLPDHCTDVNGGDNANCTDQCDKIAFCGDGLLDQGEDCDCGMDMDYMPGSCSTPNGTDGATCDDLCNTIGECSVDLWFECDPYALEDECCPDDFGNDIDCVNLQTIGICLLPCTGDADCYLNSECYTNFGACYASFCGAGAGEQAPMDPCPIGSIGQGLCVPQSRTDSSGDPDPNSGFSGICIGEGTLQQGDECLNMDALSIDRSEDSCQNGRCLGAEGDPNGTCYQFCSWIDNFDAQMYGEGSIDLPCPTGTNCLGISSLNDDGLNTGDYALCWETVEDVGEEDGITSCALTTGALLDATEMDCTDVFASGKGTCIPLYFSSSIDDFANATLLGTCIEPVDTGGNDIPLKNIWDPCNPSSDLCVSGAQCARPDAFSTNTADFVCVPFCDARRHTGANDCVEGYADHINGIPQTTVDTLDSTPVCQSFSDLAGTFGQQDIHPSPLGLCALP